MEIIRDFIPSKDNPRNSEGCFFRKKDGSFLFFYSRFYGGKEDFSASVIAGCEMDADGKSFTGEERIIASTEQFGAQNIMCPSLLTLNDGRLGLFFNVRFGHAHLVPYMMYSDDEGQTFYGGHFCVNSKRYLVLENDRISLLPDGRLLMLVSEHLPYPEDENVGVYYIASVVAFISEDNGESFREYWHFEHPNPGTCGLQEPGYSFLPDGRIFVYVRSNDGMQWTGIAEDAEHLPELKPDSRFPSPLSPLSAELLPNGKTLAIWNPIPGVRGTPDFKGPLGWHGKRAPLVCSTTQDGENWTEPLLLETDMNRGYCYTGIGIGDDFILLAYCAGSIEDGGCLNRLRVSRLRFDELP